MKKCTLALILFLAASGSINSQCLNGLQTPPETLNPTCSGALQRFGDVDNNTYSNVKVLAGTAYIFNSYTDGQFITIATKDGTTPLVWGTSPIFYIPTADTIIRYYTHTNSTCPNVFRAPNGGRAISCASDVCSIAKIVNPAVAKPTAAMVVSSTCSTMIVKWTGNTGETYRVSAVRYNPSTNKKDTVAGSTATLVSGLDYTSTIPVVPGTQITWSVEASAIINSAKLYSYPIEGTPVNYAILACGIAANTLALTGKVYLQGAYDASNMNSTLNTSGILQANAAAQPYSSSGFNYAGQENVSAGFFAAHPDIVDWVLVELRDSVVAPSIVAVRAAFVKQDGTLVDTSGTNTQVLFKNIGTGNYYVSIRHRNHLSIISNLPVNFNTGTANYDFTTAAGKVYQNEVYSSTVQVGTVWAMRGGDANVNTEAKYQGPGNDRASILSDISNDELAHSSGYYRSDINMNGIVNYQGPGNDRAFLLSAVLSNDELTVRKTQLRQ